MACDTKERIARIALELFSQHGFEAISIRDICGRAGIKESTLYYHYTNKQALLEELLRRVDDIALEKQRLFDAALEQVDHVSDEEMAFTALHLLDDYLLHPAIFPLIRMLSLERIHDQAAEERFEHIVFRMPLTQQTKVFERMMGRGLIRPGDPQAISRLYYGVVYSAFAQFCLGEKGEQANHQAAHLHIRQGILTLYCLIKP